VAEKRVTIVNVLGLHARAAARFVRAATRFRSKVTITKDGSTTDGKSILGLLFLAATAGTEIVIAASGEDEIEAVDALANLVSAGFGEAVEAPGETLS
jgi:phosphocarrier protein